MTGCGAEEHFDYVDGCRACLRAWLDRKPPCVPGDHCVKPFCDCAEGRESSLTNVTDERQNTGGDDV